MTASKPLEFDLLSTENVGVVPKVKARARPLEGTVCATPLAPNESAATSATASGRMRARSLTASSYP